jgi:hypothetical protein
LLADCRIRFTARRWRRARFSCRSPITIDSRTEDWQSRDNDTEHSPSRPELLAQLEAEADITVLSEPPFRSPLRHHPETPSLDYS